MLKTQGGLYTQHLRIPRDYTVLSDPYKHDVHVPARRIDFTLHAIFGRFVRSKTHRTLPFQEGVGNSLGRRYTCLRMIYTEHHKRNNHLMSIENPVLRILRLKHQGMEVRETGKASTAHNVQTSQIHGKNAFEAQEVSHS